MAHDEGDQWYVHYGRLSAAIEGAATTADSLRTRTADARGRAVEVAHGHAGLASAASLARLHGAFSDIFDGHVNDIHGISRRLADNHRTYKRAEAGSEDNVTWAPIAGLLNREI